MSMFIGEALSGEGNEIAHIDLLIGSKDGPVGTAFANALANQKQGHSNLLAVLTPNLICKPATVLITKVTIKGAGPGRADVRPGPERRGQGRRRQRGRGVIPKARPKTWSSSAASSSTGRPRTTPRSTSTTTRPPSSPSSEP